VANRTKALAATKPARRNDERFFAGNLSIGVPPS
jgi:hypothetical protein